MWRILTQRRTVIHKVNVKYSFADLPDAEMVAAVFLATSLPAAADAAVVADVVVDAVFAEETAVVAAAAAALLVDAVAAVVVVVVEVRRFRDGWPGRPGHNSRGDDLDV